MDQLAEMVRKFEEELNGLSALAAEDEATKIQVYADCVEIASEDERQRRRAFIQKVEKLMTPSRQKRKTTEFDEDVVVESLKIAGRKVIAEGKHVNHTIDRAFKYNEMDLVNVLLCNHREPVLDDLQQLLQMLLTSSARKAELMEFKDQAADVLKELEALRTIANTNVTTSNMPEVYELIGRHMDEAVNIDDIDDVHCDLVERLDWGALQKRLALFILNKLDVKDSIHEIPFRLKCLQEMFPVLGLLCPGGWSVEMLCSKSTAELQALCRLFAVSTQGACERADLVDALKPVLCHRGAVPNTKRRAFWFKFL